MIFGGLLIGILCIFFGIGVAHLRYVDTESSKRIFSSRHSIVTYIGLMILILLVTGILVPSMYFYLVHNQGSNNVASVLALVFYVFFLLFMTNVAIYDLKEHPEQYSTFGSIRNIRRRI
jgi:Na+/H+-dicarboxylate symporter